TCPSNVYGNSLAHTSSVTRDVSSGSWLTVIVLMVSQPVPGMVSVMVPNALNICPSNVDGYSLAHTARLTGDVSSGSWLTVIVLMVSQPVPGMLSLHVALPI